MEIKNLKKAARRIIKAVENNEKIILFGDSDPDGVCSVILLKEAVEELKGSIFEIYFPDREKQGYGLSQKALNKMKKSGPGLLVTLDCGVGNIKELKIARKMGFEPVVIDHHEVLSELPSWLIVVDPKQKKDKYPFKELSAGAVTLRVAEAIFSKKKKSPDLKKFLELAAISTLTDQMPLKNENKALVEKGLSAINKTKRQGLLALMDLTGFKKTKLPLGQKIQQLREKVLPALNLWEAKENKSQVYFLLTETSPKKANALAKHLIEKCTEKRQRISEIQKQAEKRIKKQKHKTRFIFEGHRSWPLLLAGPVASKICHRYKKPVFIFKKGRTETCGSLRMPAGFDGVKAMTNCSHLLGTYGGHTMAAGFRLKTKNLERFKKCLTKYFTKYNNSPAN